jgi:hypothetical protein
MADGIPVALPSYIMRLLNLLAGFSSSTVDIADVNFINSYQGLASPATVRKLQEPRALQHAPTIEGIFFRNINITVLYLLLLFSCGSSL